MIRTNVFAEVVSNFEIEVAEGAFEPIEVGMHTT